MRRTDLLLLILSTNLSLPAQQNVPDPASTGCPIGFGARIDGRAVVFSASDTKVDPNSPRLQLTFAPLQSPAILGASVIVHGVASSDRFLPVAQRVKNNRTQPFEFDENHETPNLTDREVLLSEIRFVNWVEVTELRFTDGSSWHPSSSAQCLAVPGKLHLVDASAH